MWYTYGKVQSPFLDVQQHIGKYEAHAEARVVM